MSEVHLLQTVSNTTKPRDPADEAAVRKAFLEFINPSARIVFDESAAETERDVDELYVCSHECAISVEIVDDLSLELWASADEPDSDWLGWYLFMDGNKVTPIWYCPMCGANLEVLITDNFGCDEQSPAHD